MIFSVYFTEKVEDEDRPLVREVVQWDKVGQTQTYAGQAENLESEEKVKTEHDMPVE